MANTEKNTERKQRKQDRKEARKEARKKAWENFSYKAKKRWRGFWKMFTQILGWTLAVIAIIVLAVSALAMTLVVNPLVVWILFLVFPKGMARFISNLDIDDLNDPWDIWKVPFLLSKWVRFLLPWSCRKYVVKEEFPCWRSSKDRVRYVGQISKERFDSLSDKEKIEVFDTYPDLHEYIITNGLGLSVSGERFEEILKDGLVFKYALKRNLSDDQWKVLIERKDFNLVWNIVSHKTPPESVLIMMADHDQEWMGYLNFLLKKHGITKNSVEALMSRLSEDHKVEARQALRIHRQLVQITTNAEGWFNGPDGASDWFQKFLGNEKFLESEAQAAMSVQQYKLFHEKGFKLDAKAALKILKVGSPELIEAMFRLEEDKGLYLPEAKELVDADSSLNDLLLKSKEQ